MKQLIIVLVVHCVVYTSYGSTQIKKLYADHLMDTVPDSPRGSLEDSMRHYGLLTPQLQLPNIDTFFPVTGATTFLALLGGILIGSAKRGALATNSYMRSRANSQRRKTTVQRREGKIEGFTANLYNLAEAFQKYNVNEPGCQLYVACEASKVQFRRKNGKLAKSVHHILSTIMKPENTGLYADDLYMKDLISAFKVGTLGADCIKFRRQCPKPKLG